MLSLRLLFVLLFPAFLGACGGEASESGPRVLVFQDGSIEDSRSVVTPAVLGISLALDGSGVAVQVVDAADPGTSLGASMEAAADPQVRAAIVAPFAALPSAARDALLQANIPVLSLSWLDEPGGAGWRRLVDPARSQAEVLARTATTLGEHVCLSGDGAPSSHLLDAETASALEDGGTTGVSAAGEPAEAASIAAARGCDVVVWTGSAEGAAALRRLLEPSVSLLLGDRARTDGFLESSWQGSRGPTLGVCSCVDLSTSYEPAAQSFIHDYQEFTGLDAGPWAAEGYDAGSMVLNAGSGTYKGLGGTYMWGYGGDLAEPHLRIYEAVGVRWQEPNLGTPTG